MATPASGPVLAEHLQGIIHGISVTIGSKVADAVSQLNDYFTTTLPAFSAEVREKFDKPTTTNVDDKVAGMRNAMTAERARIEARLVELDGHFDDVGRTAAANTRRPFARFGAANIVTLAGQWLYSSFGQGDHQ